MYSQLLLALPAVLGLASATSLPSRTTEERTVQQGGSLRSTRVRRDPSATVTGSLAVTSINDNDGTGAGNNAFTQYSGDGTAAAGWPAISAWGSFGDLFNANMDNFQNGCGQYGVADDSADEINDIKAAIEQIALQSKVDHRVILAIILQESTGCVRVATTVASGTTIYNPGLMQDHQGSNTCNFGAAGGPVDPSQSGVLNPCPSPTIVGMIQDGAQGTSSGDGLATLINMAQANGASDAEAFYVAANWYNGGTNSVAVGGDLSAYAVDIANRLVGWLN